MNRPPHFIVFSPPPPYTLPTLHRQHIEPTSNAHRAYIDSTSTQHRPDIDATLSFYFNTVPWIVKLYTSTRLPLPHFYFCFPPLPPPPPSLCCFLPTTTHHHQKDNHISFVFPPLTPPPPTNFHCFLTTTTATATVVFLPDRLFRWPVSSFLHLLPDFGYFGRSLAFLAWF